VLTGIRQQRSGLVLIVGSLLVIAVTSGFVLDWQHEARRERSRAQGASLVRLLSSLPYGRILPSDARHGALRVVRTSQSNPDFAYAVVVGLRGEPLAQEIAPDVVVPDAPLPDAPTSWVGERLLEGAHGGPIREFHAPLLRDGERVGEIRIGFREPGPAILLESASLFGALALPIFLLTPLAWSLLRRELRPVATAAGRLELLLSAHRSQRVEVGTSGEVSNFFDRFDRFVGLIERRMEELEGEASDMRASSRVLTYQKSRVESVLESLPDATVVLDEKGVAVFANSRLAPLLGVDPHAVAGHAAAEWCPHPEVVDLLAPYQGPHPWPRRSETVEFSPLDRSEVRIGVRIRWRARRRTGRSRAPSCSSAT
jgi:PAS domain-containing protein